MIKIKKLNETYLKIICNDYIENELYQVFSYKILGHKYHPKVKLGLWDGIIKMFNRKNKTIKVGLLDKITEYFDSVGYEYELDSSLVKNDTNSNILEFIKNIKIPEHIEKRDYQIDSIVDCLLNKRRLLLSPTSSGKSFIIYSIIRYLNIKTLLIVPRIGLVDQMYDDFKEYSSLDLEWEVDDFCTKISGKTKKEEKINPKQISISTWQSMSKLEDLYEDYELVIVDEAHGAKANVITNILDACVNAEYRLGFTGTIKDDEVNELMLNGLFGSTKQFIKTRELIDRGFAADIKINCYVLKYNQETQIELKKLNSKIKDKDRTKIGRQKYENELSLLYDHKVRNAFICKLALKLEGNTLIYFNRVDSHGKKIFNMLQNMIDPEKHNLYYIDGSVDERNDIRKSMESRNKKNLGVFSGGTSGVGMSIRNVDHLIFAYLSKDKITVLQTIGRGLRMSDTKKRFNFFDISDILNPKKTNFSYKHFVERLKKYEEENFEYTIKEITIE
jgi:superfamily II DNA or RNA helicase